MATFINVTSISANGFETGRTIIDLFASATGSEGWTTVESRIVVSSMEWSVFKKPSSLGVVSRDYYVALGVASSLPNSYAYNQPSYLTGFSANSIRLFGTIFEGWNTSSKMISLYCNSSRISRTLTNSFTDFTSPSFLPGSAFDCKMLTVANELGAAYTIKIHANQENVMVQYFSGGASSGSGLFATGNFDSVLPPADDPLPIFFGPVFYFNQLNANPVINKWQFGDVIVLTSPGQSTDSMLYTFATMGRNNSSPPTTSPLAKANNGIAVFPPYDSYSNKNAIAPCAVHRGFYDTETSASLRGLTPNFFIAASLTTSPTWFYNGTSYSGEAFDRVRVSSIDTAYYTFIAKN